MRLMVVGHPFFLAHNQKKYVAMKQIDPELQLRLVVPARGHDRFDLADCQVHRALTPEEVVPLKTHLARSHMTYLHSPRSMVEILNKFQPDVLHIEEEPQASITVETIALQRVLARCATVTLFSWDNLLRHRRFPLGAVKRKMRSYSLARVAEVICGNRRAAELLNAEGLFSGLIDVFPQYGLDVAEHRPGIESELRAELGLEGSVVVGHIGRLVPEKGLRLLIDALSHLRSHPWKLLLVGAGPFESEIRERWMADFPGRIVLVQAVPHSQVARYLRCVDIFVLASYSTPSWMEQFGLTLAQAMLVGVASIGSTSGAIPEVLGPGGLLFEEGQVEGLERDLESLLVSPERREQLGTLGREFALRNYTTEHVAARYLAAFERVRSCSAAGKQSANEAVPSSFAERKG